MKHLHIWIAFAIFAFISTLALPQGRWNLNSGFNGGAYFCTVKDSNGNFASRSVITLHSDQTMSVIDSGQEGPNFFSSQRGSWKTDGRREIAARAIDFIFPQSGSGIARTDFTLAFSRDGSQVTGTIELMAFGLDEDPLEREGTLIGRYTFKGRRIEPR